MRAAVLLAIAASVATVARGQELEPRAFSPGPTGLNIVAATASRSSGDLVFDSSLPLEGVTSDVNVAGFGYQRFFGLFGKTAKVAVAGAWVDAEARGLVADQYHERNFSGPGDPRVAMSWIFLGAPAMTPEQYAKYRPGTIAGISASLSAPLGEYEPDKLLNAGTNRWSLRTQLGLSHYKGPWTFEGILGAQFFTDNDEFFGGTLQEQDPIYSTQLHCAYTIRRQMWVAASATYYRGGESTINGDERPGFQSNSRYGVSASIPLVQGQSLGVNYSRGLATRIGSDYSTLIVAWSARWLRKKK